MDYKNKKNNAKKAAPKAIIKSLPVVITGRDSRGNEYDTDSCRDFIIDLQDDVVFSRISISVSMTKARAFGNPDQRGFIDVATIREYDIENDAMSIVFFGGSMKFADLIDDDSVIIPKVRINKSNGSIMSITGFQIVSAMEA